MILITAEQKMESICGIISSDMEHVKNVRAGYLTHIFSVYYGECKVKKGFWQFVKFALVGVSNTLISEGVYALLVFFKMHYLLAGFIGFSLSVLNACFWNGKYVFKQNDSKRTWWKTLVKTYLAYFWGYLVNAALLVFWIEIVDICSWMKPLAAWFIDHGMERFDEQFLGSMLAAGINLLVTVPMNFVINKYWAYGQKRHVG